MLYLRLFQTFILDIFMGVIKIVFICKGMWSIMDMNVFMCVCVCVSWHSCTCVHICGVKSLMQDVLLSCFLSIFWDSEYYSVCIWLDWGQWAKEFLLSPPTENWEEMLSNGLDKNSSPRLTYLNGWSPIVRHVWEGRKGLVGGHFSLRVDFEDSKPHSIPSLISLPHAYV